MLELGVDPHPWLIRGICADRGDSSAKRLEGSRTGIHTRAESSRIESICLPLPAGVATHMRGIARFLCCAGPGSGPKSGRRGSGQRGKPTGSIANRGPLAKSRIRLHGMALANGASSNRPGNTRTTTQSTRSTRPTRSKRPTWRLHGPVFSRTLEDGIDDE